MKEIKFESPAMVGNPSLMGLCWMMAAQKTVMDGMMQKYFPVQYQMMEAFKKLGKGEL